MNELYTALIVLFGTAIGTFGGIITSNKLTKYRLDQAEMNHKYIIENFATKDDIKTLSEHVEKHNSLIDRTYKLETKTELHEKGIETLERYIRSKERV